MLCEASAADDDDEDEDDDANSPWVEPETETETAATLGGVNEAWARLWGALAAEPTPASSVEVVEVDLDRGRAFEDDFEGPPLEVILIGIFG